MTDNEIFDTQWDAIIIGAGMGGCTAAYQLARQQKRVLLVEKGYSSFKQYQGVEVEQEDPKERLENGKWPSQLTATVDGSTTNFWAPLGCGVGGSSLLYAAALQRLLPSDFELQTLPNGETIQWPFDYQTLETYYQQAETLFSVCGTPDPLDCTSQYQLKAPPAMCDADQYFFQSFQQAGLHPYRLHVAINYEPSCGECGGHICPKRCKQDSNNACIQPALESGYLTILDKTDVIRINANADTVTDIEVIYRDEQKQLQGKSIVLAAGAYFTPVILQRSVNQYWPQGLANQSSLVGKNLMFHASDFIAFWPKQKCSTEGAKKTIATRDLYNVGTEKWGEFQSAGLHAGYGYVLYALRLLFDQSPLRKLKPLRHFLRIPAYIASKLFGEATIFTTIVEDFPYAENRIVLDEKTPSGMRVEYTIHDEFRRRVLGMKAAIRKRLSQLKSLPMGVGINLNYGHPCGTCRAGDDPLTSVVDKNCKAHGLTNLYIADSSFMPTSGGTNPSLTIAANALRVADHIICDLNS